ncbi:MAG: glycosyltransferase [Phycisphaerales bacterium]
MIDPRTPDFTCTPASHRRPAIAYQPGRQFIAAAGAKPASLNGHASLMPSDGTSDATPAVTVITPFYNTREVFRETAASIFNQSLQNFEWLIIDDGSTDAESLAILAEFRHIDPRVRVITHDVNRGLSAARNTGFREARASMVIPVDSDDLIEPTTLEKCAWYLHTHPEASWVKGFSVGFGAQEYLWTRGFHEGSAFLRENLATATTMVRRGAWERASVGRDGGAFDESNRGGLEDWEFWIRCASLGMWGATIPEYLDWYRRREAAPLTGDAWQNLSSVDRADSFLETMRSRYPRLYSDHQGEFPHATPQWHMPFEPVRGDLPLENPVDLVNPQARVDGPGDGARRLLLIAPWLTLGGADKFNLAMTRELTARGWSVTIATTVPGDNSWQPEFTNFTPDVFALPHFLRMPDFPLFLRYLIGSRRPDVVMVSNSELGYHLLPYLRAHHPAPAYVDLCHMEEPWWKNGGYPRYAIGCQPSLDANIVSSEHLKQWMVERGADAGRIKVCHVSDTRGMTRDDEARQRVRDEQGIEPDELVMLYAGRLVLQKQPRVFAHTMRLVAEENPFGWACLVAGDGPDMGWLRDFVAEHGLRDRVRLLGAIPQERMRELYSASDVFFLPSQWEGIALSVFEAMATGLAIVGADVGGQRELVTPECGVLMPRGDEAAEAEAFAEHLLALIRDPASARRAGSRGAARIREHFTPEKMAERLEAIFERARELAERAPRETPTPAFASEIACRGVEYIRAFSLAEMLWCERDNLRSECDTLRSLGAGGHSGGHLSMYVDPAAEARRIIEANLRYRVVDRMNNAMKTMGVHSALKVVTVRALRMVKRARR